MLFSSLVFLFTFLPITLLVYYLVPRKVKNVVLLIASLIFYAWGEPVYIFLMLISILFNYFCGMDIALKAGRKSQVRSLIFTIVVNLFILGFFKYYGFIVTNLNAILPFYIPYRKLELPIGISFYTFQTLSYIIDVYRGNVDVQVNLIDFGTYVTMFPQLIAGPIVQYADVERQLRERKESLTKFGYGAWFFVMGLAKKVLLANTIGSIYENIAAMDGMSVVTAWLGCLAYTFQIYFDFSGYSDMAVGLGKMFGFEFMQNFNYPYISKSVTEFWRRWHISLGSWFREYVYIPLGGNRVTVPRHLLNLLIVWFLTGLWHGASWKYVAFGFWNGMVILVSTLLQPVSDKVVAALHIERKSAWYQVFSMLRTFVVVLIGYYFDIADGFRAAMGMMLKSVTDLHLSQLRPGAVLEALPLTRYDWCVLLFGTVVIFTASVIQERSQRTIREILDEKCLALRWAVLLAGIFAVVLMGVYGPGVQASEFVYMQF